MSQRIRNVVRVLGEYLRSRNIGMTDYLKKFIAGVWLLVLYAISTAIVVYSLSAYQLVHSINLSDGEFTVWKIRDVHAEWKRHQVRMDSAIHNARGLAEDIAYYDAENSYWDGEIVKVDGAARAVKQDIRSYLRGAGVDEQQIETLLADRLPEPQDGGPPHLSADGKYAALYRDYSAIMADLTYATSSRDAARASGAQMPQRLEQAEDQITAARKGMEAALAMSGIPEDEPAKRALLGDYLNKYGFFQDGGPSSYSDREYYVDDPVYMDRPGQNEHWLTFGLRTLVDAFRSMIGAVGHAVAAITPDFWRASILTEMPSEMLTLIVVVAMGALGGTIHLTQLYFRQRDGRPENDADKGLWYFIFRPMLGCITALSVFILAKAGVLVVSTPGLGEPGGTLSPYFVAFLGIISGLLAESALRTIQEAGNRWFSTAQALDRERWAYGLADRLKGAGAETQKTLLQNLLGVPAGTLDEWIAEDAPVPGKYQTPIAAFFRLPLREIFSDLPANKMSVESAGN